MKKILISICLFTVWITSYSQINCNGTSASTVNPTDKLAICNGNLQRTVTASQLVDAGIDTTKVGRIEQGRGTAPIFMYFNGVAWVRNDTSYVPKNTNILNVNNSFSVGLSGYDNALSMFRNNYTSLVSKNITPLGGQSNVIVSSLDSGYIQLGIVPSNVSYSRLFSIKGTNYTYPTKSFEFTNGLAHYNGDYRTYMIDDETIPDIGKVKQLISDSVGTVQSTTLADGKIWIGDGTDTAFPRTLSGDVTINNLGEATVDSINGITKSYYDPTSSIQTQLNNKQPTLTDANFATFVNSTANKTTPVDANIVPIVDVSTGKRFSLSNLWTNWLVNKIQTTALTISVAWERKGVANNSSAASGYIGEVLRASGSGVSIANGTTTAIGSLSLPPGNYQVEGTITFVPAGGASLGTQACSVSETSANIPLGEGANIRRRSGTAFTTDGDTIPTSTLEVKKSTTGNVYLNGFVQFTGGTVSCTWTIKALRVR